jgi:hypothetical protein
VEDASSTVIVSNLEPTEQPATIAQRVAATVKKSELVSMFGQLVDKDRAGRKQTEPALEVSESTIGANATAVVATKPVSPSLNSDTVFIAEPKSAIATTSTGAPWWKFWESAGEDLDGIEESQISAQLSTPSEPPRAPIARQDSDALGTINDAPDAAKSTFSSLWTSLWGSSQDDTPTPEITPASPEITSPTPEITPAVNNVAVTQTTIDTEREGNRRQSIFWFMHRENESSTSGPSEGTPHDGNFTRLTSLWRLPRFGSNENKEILAETAPGILAETAPGADVGELQAAIPAAESDSEPATIDPPRSHFFSRFLVRQEPPQSELDSEIPQSTSIRSRLLSFFGIRREDQQEQAEIAPAAVATPKAIIATRPSIGITTRSTQPDSIPANGAEPGKENPVMNHLRTNPPILVR